MTGTTRQRQRQPWQKALRRLQMRRQRDADTIDFDAVRMPPPPPPLPPSNPPSAEEHEGRSLRAGVSSKDT
jgi:hypothetical protein